MRFVAHLLLILAAAATGTIVAARAMPRPAAAIDPARLSAHIRIFASDAFEGRGRGTAFAARRALSAAQRR
jgi:hypothetical protein